ncbi:MAG: sulfur-carrier protein [Actinomycetota bacterium]|nr:sulfur-carrier protein [Actinomycetota bacterium]
MRVVFELAGPLRQHAAGAVAVEVDVPDGASVTDALDALAKAHPGVERRIRDDEGLLRRHVNLFAGGDLVRGSEHTTALCPGERLVVLPAVSGGSVGLS